MWLDYSNEVVLGPCENSWMSPSDHVDLDLCLSKLRIFKGRYKAPKPSSIPWRSVDWRIKPSQEVRGEATSVLKRSQTHCGD